MSDSGADVQPLVTQCPSCHTQFRVSENQLQVAGGKVRCGACLAVFQGVDNLVWEGDETPDGPGGQAGDAGDLDELLEDIAATEPEDEPTAGQGAAKPSSMVVAEAAAATGSPPVTAAGASNAEEDVVPPPRRTLEISLDDLEAQLLSGEPLDLSAPDQAAEGLAATDSSEAGVQDDPGVTPLDLPASGENLIPGDKLMDVKRDARTAAAAANAANAANAAARTGEDETRSPGAPPAAQPKPAGPAPKTRSAAKPRAGRPASAPVSQPMDEEPAANVRCRRSLRTAAGAAGRRGSRPL